MLKNNVLRKKSDFDSIYNRGKSVGDRYIVLFYRKNNLPYNRTGFLASKKVGNSVQRNRARRLMYESFRLYEPQTKQGYYMVMVAKSAILQTDFETIRLSLGKILERAELTQ